MTFLSPVRGKTPHSLISRFRSFTRSISQVSIDNATSSKPPQPSSVNDIPTPLVQATTSDALETTHYVKQSLLDAKVIYCLAPWIMCGIYEIQVSVDN